MCSMWSFYIVSKIDEVLELVVIFPSLITKRSNHLILIVYDFLLIVTLYIYLYIFSLF